MIKIFILLFLCCFSIETHAQSGKIEGELVFKKIKKTDSLMNYCVFNEKDTTYNLTFLDVWDCNYLQSTEKSHNKCRLRINNIYYTGEIEIHFFNKNVTSIFEGYFEAGYIVQGSHATYYLNGKLKRFGKYFNNWKTGTWCTYYENGTLESCNLFYKGIDLPFVNIAYNKKGEFEHGSLDKLYFNDTINNFGDSIVQIVDSNIYFKPVFINQCKNTIENSDYYNIYDTNNVFVKSSTPCIIGELTLPNMGHYIFDSGCFGNLEFEINKLGLNIDTFYIPKLIEKNCIGICNDYYVCDSIANGYLEDFYYNGQVRCRGNFKNGKIIDSVFLFYQSGDLKEIIFSNSILHNTVIKFYKNGQLKEYYDPQHYELTMFYETGELRKRSKWEKKYSTKVYNKTGKLRYSNINNKQYIYYENGMLQEKIIQKELWKLDRILHPNDYQYYSDRFFETHWSSYDQKGKVKIKIVLDQTNNWIDFENTDDFSKLNSINFESVLIYDRGKRYKLIQKEHQNSSFQIYQYHGFRKLLIGDLKEENVKQLIEELQNEIK